MKHPVKVTLPFEAETAEEAARLARGALKASGYVGFEVESPPARSTKGVGWDEDSVGYSDTDPDFVTYLESDFRQFEEWRAWNPLLLAKYVVTQKYQFEQEKEHAKLRTIGEKKA